MAEHIIKRLYSNGCFNLYEFISSLVYEKRDDHLKYMEHVTSVYRSFVDKIFLTFPPCSNLPAFPAKLTSTSSLVKKDFFEFYSSSQFTLPCQMFSEKIFPMLTKERPLIPMFSIELWDAFYGHIGDTWLKFIFRHGSLFILFPQDCLLQITGKAMTDKYYEVTTKAKRKFEFEEVSGRKRLKIGNDICAANLTSTPVVSFHGSRLTVELTKMMYSKNLIMAFPRLHALEELKKAVPDEASKLIELIFQHGKNVLKAAEGVKCSLEDSVIVSLKKNETTNKIMQALLKNHRKIHFLKMLDFHCPSDACVVPTMQSYCSSKQICDFLSAIIHRVIPLDLFGSKHNKGKMQDFCKVFVNASKGDHFSLEHLLYCMRIDDCKWIPEFINGALRQIVFAVVMNWLFSDYLLAVLQGYFYITDFEGQKKRLFFYKKNIWKTLNTNSTMQLISSKILHKRCKNQSEEKEPSCGIFACSGGARLLPKKMQPRLILNLKPSKKLSAWLKTYLCVLDYIANRKSKMVNSLAGCSISSMSDFHAVWHRFVDSFRVKDTLACLTPLFFVKLDIHDCFSSVKLDLLEKVLWDVCKFAEHIGVKDVDVYAYFKVNKVTGRLLHQYKRLALPKNECFLAHLKDAGHTGNILVDLERVITFSVQKIIEDLILHLKSISVKLGREHFNLTQGLGQGSLLSPILSSLYYGHMENSFLSEFISAQKKSELLVRYVDDYFLVVSEKERAQKFLSIMHPGIQEYNCGTSCTKVLTNFDVEPNEENSFHTCAKKRDLIPWLGMLINSKTLEITDDFSQYAGQSIAHTMTLDASMGKEGLKEKMRSIISPGIQCILFDRRINSKRTIIKNLYEYSLLNAFRMHSLSTKLPKFEGADKHPEFYAQLTLACVNQICVSLIKLKYRQMIIYPLKNCVSKWICLQAFIAKLKRHEVKYHEVLKKISAKSNEFEIKIGKKEISCFRRAVGPWMPPTFREMEI